MELGIVVHSLVIGISLGASERPSTIRPLLGALSFHQFFEGIGLGGCIVQVCVICILFCFILSFVNAIYYSCKEIISVHMIVMIMPFWMELILIFFHFFGS